MFYAHVKSNARVENANLCFLRVSHILCFVNNICLSYTKIQEILYLQTSVAMGTLINKNKS